MHDDLTPAEQALLAEHAQREHEERMADPEFRKGWDRMSSLLAAEAEVKQLRADLVTVSKEAADLEGLAVDLGVKLKETEAERDAIEAARCPSCDHLPTGHQEDGCWYAVTTGTPGRDLVCPCTLPVGALDGQARTTTDNRRDAVSAVIKPIIKRRNDAMTPEQIAAHIRDPESPLYPTQICVFCDRCGVTVEHDYLVHEDMDQRARLEVARAHLRSNAGWSCDADGDFCRACRAIPTDTTGETETPDA